MFSALIDTTFTVEYLLYNQTWQVLLSGHTCIDNSEVAYYYTVTLTNPTIANGSYRVTIVGFLAPFRVVFF